jgi:hypothetical protein
MVDTEARLGASPGLTRITERRSESSIVTNSTALCRIGSMSSSQRQRNGTARLVAISCLISSLATSELLAQNGNMFLAASSSYSAFSAASRLGSRCTLADISFSVAWSCVIEMQKR